MKSSRVGPPPPFLVPKGGLVRMTSALGSVAPSGDRVSPRARSAVDVVEHGVHQQQAVGVGHQFDAVEGLRALELLLRFGEVEVVVGGGA